MYESDTEKEDLLSEFKSFCQLYKQMLQDDVISEVHKIRDVLHFLEIREMSRIFQSWPTFIEYRTFCLSEVHLLNKVLAD